jgi:hypothetical protein
MMMKAARAVAAAAGAAGQFLPWLSLNAASILLTWQGTCRSLVCSFTLIGSALTSVTLCPLAFKAADHAPTLSAITVTQGKGLDLCDVHSQMLLHEGNHIMLRGHNFLHSACMSFLFYKKLFPLSSNP